LIHNNSSDIDRPDSWLRGRFSEELYKRGVGADRVKYIGVRDYSDHFLAIAQCDIALDSFPYNGTTTTGDCLWMGVPVITLACATHAGRVGLSILSRLGLSEYATFTASDYVDLASNLALDTNRIISLRLNLRGQMQKSSLTNARAVMSGIEVEFRSIWRDMCRHHADTELKG